jgi:hypothetical protein
MENLINQETLTVRLVRRWITRFRDFDSRHFSEIKAALEHYNPTLNRVRNRSIETLKDSDRHSIQRISRDFEVVLGPVGAAKCLHPNAPPWFLVELGCLRLD